MNVPNIFTTLDKPNFRRIRTVPFRMSFPVLPPMPPRVDPDSGRQTYQLSMLFPANTDQKPFRDALREAMVVKFGPDPKQWPRNIKQTPDTVLKDFDNYNSTAKTPLSGDWRGWMLVRANSTVSHAIKPPNVVGPIMIDKKFPVITDLREIYGGRWARATIDAYYFEIRNKNNGVTFGLSNVQLLKHDKRFAGDRPDAEQDFEDASPEWAGHGDAFETGGDFDVPKQDSQW